MTTTVRCFAATSLVTLFVIALSTACNTARAGTPITVLNPGFEDGTLVVNQPLDHWTQTQGHAAAAGDIHDGTPFGSWSMAVAAGGAAVQTTSHTITANDMYTLSFSSARTGADTGSNDINATFFADNAGVLTPLASIPTGLPGPGIQNWAPYQAQFDFPAAAFAGQNLAIGFSNTSSGWAGVDEVSLEFDLGTPPPPPTGDPLPFFEDFNGFTAPPGNFNGGQSSTGLAVAHSGDLPDWSKSGGGAVHVVDHANVFADGINNPRDFAVMFWTDNIITLDSEIAANDAGQTYIVSFDASPATYQGPDGPGSQATTDTDGILIDVLRHDGTVLDSYTHNPGTWAQNLALVPDSFQYVGDGSGPVRVRIGPSAFGSGHFGGAIDNLSIVVPEPSCFALASLALFGLRGIAPRKRKRA